MHFCREGCALQRLCRASSVVSNMVGRWRLHARAGSGARRAAWRSSACSRWPSCAPSSRASWPMWAWPGAARAAAAACPGGGGRTRAAAGVAAGKAEGAAVPQSLHARALSNVMLSLATPLCSAWERIQQVLHNYHSKTLATSPPLDNIVQSEEGQCSWTLLH